MTSTRGKITVALLWMRCRNSVKSDKFVLDGIDNPLDRRNVVRYSQDCRKMLEPPSMTAYLLWTK